ncbi:hypothetical protein D3C72_1843350 [compost metagenome]
MGVLLEILAELLDLALDVLADGGVLGLQVIGGSALGRRLLDGRLARLGFQVGLELLKLGSGDRTFLAVFADLRSRDVAQLDMLVELDLKLLGVLAVGLHAADGRGGAHGGNVGG